MSSTKLDNRESQADSIVDWAEITLTHRCNQRCFFCYEDGRDLACEPDLESVKSLLRETRKHAEQVVLCGKEVLLRRDVLDIIRYASSLGLIVVVFSNGQALAREGLIEQLVEAGANSISVSFHFPDPQIFALGSRTTERGFHQIIQGLNNFRKYKEQHPQAPIDISTETDMFALNVGRLSEMRNTLIDALGKKNWKMRLGCLLPTKTYDIGLKSVLEPLNERRQEIQHFVESHPDEIPLRFVKTPLCLIRGFEHLALETEYLYNGTLLTFNHSDAERITVDPYSTSIHREIIKPLERHPYRWVCRTCNLLPMCRFERVDWSNKFFLPAKSQKPEPYRTITARQILARIGPDKTALETLEQYEGLVRAYSFPEEHIITSLAHKQENGPALIDVYSDHRPILVTEFEHRGHRLKLRLELPRESSENLTVVDYITISPVDITDIPSPILLSCYKAIARQSLPDISSWSDTLALDSNIAKLYRSAWFYLGERIWPGFGSFHNWQTTAVTLSDKNRLRITLLHPSSMIAMLFFDVDPEKEAAWPRISITLSDKDGHGEIKFADYDELLNIVGQLVNGEKVSINSYNRDSITRGLEAAFLEKGAWKINPAVSLFHARGAIRFSVKDSTSPNGENLFFVSAYRSSEPYFQKVGSLTVRHNRTNLGQGAMTFMQVVIAAMKVMQSRPLSSANVRGWRKAVGMFLDRVGLNEEFAWQVEYIEE